MGETHGISSVADGTLWPVMQTKSATDIVRCRAALVDWLNSLFPHLQLPSEASEEDLRASLVDGTILYGILNRMNLSPADESQVSPVDKVKKFAYLIEQMGLPTFRVSDLQQGSLSSVVDCLLALRGHFNSDHRGGASSLEYGIQLRKKWQFADSTNSETVSGCFRGDHFGQGPKSPRAAEERKRSLNEMRFQLSLHGPVLSEPSTAMSHHVGQKFHEVFQQKQGRYSDLPPAKILEMLKATSLDNAPTQSLLSVVNGILDESMDKKNGEIPHRVACLLRKAVQEIERRISTQAEHIRNQNNLIKARDEKYLSRIKLLETLASGTTVETEIATSQLQQLKTEKLKVEETKRLGELDVIRLTKEKECCDVEILELKKELERTRKFFEEHCQQLGAEAMGAKRELEARLKEAECLLVESEKKNEQLEALSQSKGQHWREREYTYQDFLNFQLEAVQEMRTAFGSIKNAIFGAQRSWQEEFNYLGSKLKGIVDTAQNYHIVLAENRKLYNEVQDLKGNIRVYCRVRPFLCAQSAKQSIIEYIGEDGELVIANPSKQGKDGLKSFKFSKIFGASSSQAEVFLDTQPLVRSILDGYNVCIFAYGQTGSGKTYTMVGPEGASKEEWGVNYRALHDLFHISKQRKCTFTYEIGVQMVEIYNEQVRDLLLNGGAHKRLGIWSISQPNGLALPDASLHPVNSIEDVLGLMETGHANRAVGATALNDRSSRSHCVVTVHVRGVDLKDGSALRGSLHLVDLAGSERVDRSEATGERLKEAQHINKSLSALGDVIFALAQKSAHVPYRNSKLTQILQSSLGGQAKTLMFVQINPDINSYSESFSTLKFAERVSGVELGAARSSKESRVVREMMEQVASLKDMIAKKDEDIERLQHLGEVGNGSPVAGGGNRQTCALRHSSSSPGRPAVGHGTSNRCRSLSSGRAVGLSEKTCDTENWSEYSDKHSEVSSQQSAEDYGSQKELWSQQKLSGADLGEHSTGDLELLGLGDDYEERLSDISDGGISMEAETDGSMCSDLTPFSDGVRPAQNDDRSKISQKVRQPPLNAELMISNQLAGKESAKILSKKASSKSLSAKESLNTLKSSRVPLSLRKSGSQVLGSSTRTARRWQ